MAKLSGISPVKHGYATVLLQRLKFAGLPGAFPFFPLFICLLQSCTQVEQKPRNYLVGIINPNKDIDDMHLGFIEGLVQYGFVEGKNTKYIITLGDDDLNTALGEMIANNFDLIFTLTTPATKKTCSAVKDKVTPVVFALFDPVSGGIIKSLSDPGENITGIQTRGSISKALDWLLKFSPDIKKILVPIKFDTPAAKLSLSELRKAADIGGLTLVVQELSNQADIKKAFEEHALNFDAVFMLHSLFISSNTENIVQEAMKYKLPVGGGVSFYITRAMITYGVFAKEFGKQASRQASQFLRDTPTGKIPAELDEFYMGVNLEIAHNAHIVRPNEILIHADDIIPYKENN